VKRTREDERIIRVKQVKLTVLTREVGSEAGTVIVNLSKRREGGGRNT